MKKFIYIFIVMAAVACSNKDEIPKDLISKEKMVDILVDIHLMESRIEASRYLSRDSMQVAFLKKQADILKKYKVDSTKYYTTYDYYFEKMTHMRDIYEEVATRIKTMMEKAEKAEKQQGEKTKKEVKKTKKPTIKAVPKAEIELPLEKEEKPK